MPDAFAVEGPAGRNWGASEKQYAIEVAPVKRTSHVIFLDDDDIMLLGALDTFRQCASQCPDRLILARYQSHQAGVIWKYPIVAYGNVGVPCICAPWNDHLMGSFMSKGGRHENDLDFIESTILKAGQPVWLDRVVQITRRLEDAPVV